MADAQVTPPLHAGEAVVIVTDTGRTVAAVVVLASDNGRSVLLSFDAMIGGWVGMLPASLDDDGAWTALNGIPLTIRRPGPSPRLDSE